MGCKRDLAYLGCSASVGIFGGFSTFCLALWLATGFTTSYLVVGLLGNSRSLVGAVVSPLAGAWSDRTWVPWLGRRRPFVLVGGLLAALLLALTPTISHWPVAGPLLALPEDARRLAPVIMATLLVTVAFNAMDDIHKALLVDVAPERGRNRLASMALLVEMGGQLGILLLGFMAWQHAVPDVAFVVTGALMAAGVIVTVLGVREPPPGQKYSAPVSRWPSYKETSAQSTFPRSRGAAAFFFSMFAFGFGLSAVLPLLSLYTRDILGATIGQAQLLPALLFLSITLLALPMGRLADHYGKRRVISGGYLLLMLVSLAGLVITTREAGAAVFILAGAGTAAILAPRIPLLAELVPETRMGTAAGLLAAVGSVAAPAGSLVAAVCSDWFGPRAIFAVMAAMVGLGLAAMPFTRPAPQPATLFSKVSVA